MSCSAQHSCDPPWVFTTLGVLVGLPIMSIALALGAVYLGKYLSFAFIVQDEFSGAPSIASAEMRELFSEAGDAVWGGYDILWFVLAAVAAVRGSFTSSEN